MKKLLAGETFDFISREDKQLIAAFDGEMARRGYTCGGVAVPGHCWGRYMLVYTKAGVKSKKSYARVYLREEDTVLRLYLSGVDKHREAVEQAPDFVQQAFCGAFPACDHCHGKVSCVHQKRYTLHGKDYEICDGKAFWFFQPDVQRLPAYMALFEEFYPTGRRG